MILTVDVGNTNVKTKLFKTGKSALEKIMVASVNPGKLKQVMPRLKKYKKEILVVGKDIKVPLESRYNSRQIGQDRLVTAFAAGKIYGRPALILDFGTALTFDVVSKDNVYLGGIILPGIKMSLESLHNKTALLPEVEFKKAKGFVGKNTRDSIRNGMIYGYAAICEGLIKKFRKKYKNLNVVATGGNAKLISRYTSSIQKVDENLSLKGLHLLSKV